MEIVFSKQQFLVSINTTQSFRKIVITRKTTTTKPDPTKWGQLHESNDVIVFYQKPCLEKIENSDYMKERNTLHKVS